MTDLPSPGLSVPGRLGLVARLEDGQLVVDLVSQTEALHCGVLRASVIAYAIDAVAGIDVDDDADVWTLTTDLSVRMLVRHAPPFITATTRVLRRGGRSVTCGVEVTADDGTPLATGAVGFAHIPRKPTDPPKIQVRPEDAPAFFRDAPMLSLPLRQEAGVVSIDRANGVVEIEVTPPVRNPNGTLQGAMVALVAEAAAEDLVETRLGAPAVVTDLDIRYLARAERGPVRSRCRVLGDGPAAPIEVQLVDTSTDTITTLVYARAVAR